MAMADVFLPPFKYFPFVTNTSGAAGRHAECWEGGSLVDLKQGQQPHPDVVVIRGVQDELFV
eukprot:12888519-Prorocentrum_lima.AAC.1